MGTERDPFKDVDRLTKERLMGRDMSSIRKEFQDLGYPETEVRSFISMIDRSQKKTFEAAAASNNAKFLLIGGAVFVLIGVGITVSTFHRALNAGGGPYVLMYGAILVGIGMIAQGFVLKGRSRGSSAS